MVLQSTLFACLFTCARVAREQKTCGRCFVFFIFGTLGCKSCVSVECLRFVSNTRLLRRSSECANFSKTKPRSALFRTQKLCAHTHTRVRTRTRALSYAFRKMLLAPFRIANGGPRMPMGANRSQREPIRALRANGSQCF